MTPRISIGIAGAGIGGLALGALAAQAGHRVVICDQFDAPRPVGSGLMIQPIGLAVLDRAGAGDLARQYGQRIGRMLGLEARTRARVLDVTYDPTGRAEKMGLAIHRASLFQALLQAAEARGVSIIPAATVSEAPLEGAQRRLTLANGQSLGPFDLVVDATGAKSPLSPLKSRPLPYGAVWGTVPWPDATDLPQDHLSQRYRRASHMAGVLPIGRLPDRDGLHAAVFWSMPVTALSHWPRIHLPAWKAEVASLWPAMAPFLETISDPARMTPARYTHGTLRKPYSDALAFIGDAAHRASPQLGQGANMALLDALALFVALERHTGEAALRDYAAMRRWHVRLYQGMSAAFTPQYQSDSRVLPALRDYALAPLSLTPPLPLILSRLVAGQLIPPLAGERFP